MVTTSEEGEKPVTWYGVHSSQEEVFDVAEE